MTGLPNLVYLTDAQIAALKLAAESPLTEWEAYDGEGMPNWDEASIDALGAAVVALGDADPTEQCRHCGGKLREYEDGYECRDCGQPAIGGDQR